MSRRTETVFRVIKQKTFKVQNNTNENKTPKLNILRNDRKGIIEKGLKLKKTKHA